MLKKIAIFLGAIALTIPGSMQAHDQLTALDIADRSPIEYTNRSW